MILSHYTDAKPWTFDPLGTLPPPAYDRFFKPHGLWLSVDGDDDWISWCRTESFGVERMKQRHIFEIARPERLLMIDSVAGIEALHRHFATQRSGMSRSQFKYLNWDAVAAEFGGVIIAPYQEECRLGGPASSWYYGWDCASGCVWEANALRFLFSEPCDGGTPCAT